jgi:Tfp pilus assembly protein PilV
MIELVIAMSLLVIAIVPLTGVIWAGFKAEATTSHRTDAFSVAAGEIESLHADPYALVGFYSDESAEGWKGNTTVIIGPCSTTCASSFAPLILPVGTTTVAGVTYSIARYVYWANAQGVNNGSTSTTFLQAYKATTVTVSWKDPSGSHTVEQDSVVYPGGQGLYSGPGGSSPTTTSTTAPLQAPGVPTITIAGSQPASPQNQQEIDVTIAPSAFGGPVAVYYVQWSTDSNFGAPSQSPQLPPTSSSYAAQGLAAATKYYFRMFAGNATGQSGYSTPVVSATTASVPATTTTVPGTTTSSTVPATTTTTLPCSLGAFTITTSVTGKTYLHNGNGNMTENVVLNLAITGSCFLSVTVNSVLHGTMASDPGSPYSLSGPSGGGQWSYTIPSSGQAGWSVGTHDLTVLIGGSATSVTHGLLVCAYTKNPSALSTTC